MRDPDLCRVEGALLGYEVANRAHMTGGKRAVVVQLDLWRDRLARSRCFDGCEVELDDGSVIVDARIAYAEAAIGALELSLSRFAAGLNTFGEVRALRITRDGLRSLWGRARHAANV